LIRIEINNAQRATVFPKVLQKSQFNPSGLLNERLVNELNRDTSTAFLDLLEKSGFWNMPVSLSLESHCLCFGDSLWVLEALKEGKYYVVKRGGCKNSSLEGIGSFLFYLCNFKNVDDANGVAANND